MFYIGSSSVYQHGIMEHHSVPANPLKRKPSEISFDEDGWRKAWQIKFKYGKSNNLSVWLIDRLTRSEGGRWLNMENGRFELEWIDTANAWYAERQRRSKSSQSTHLLYKALQAAFPSIIEEASEKNKHIFVRRSFKLPEELCDEVRQIVIGTGTKHPATKTIQIPVQPVPLAQQNISPYLVDSSSVLLPTARYKVPDNLMKDFMSAVSSSPSVRDSRAVSPVTKLVSAWNMDLPTEAPPPDCLRNPSNSACPPHYPEGDDDPVNSHMKIGSPPMSPGFLSKGASQHSVSHEATFEQICEYAKQQLEIIHKWASDMASFKSLSCNDQKALLTSSAPEILVFSICCFSVQKNAVRTTCCWTKRW